MLGDLLEVASVAILSTRLPPFLFVLSPLKSKTNAGDACAMEFGDAFFCYVYDEGEGIFVPWGTNAELKLLC